MVLINIISNIPFLSSEDNLVLKNQISLALGIALYAIIGGLIYADKIPPSWLSMIPDKRYLLLVAALDLTIFFVVHRFQYGSFPQLTHTPKIVQPPKPLKSILKKPRSSHRSSPPPRPSNKIFAKPAPIFDENSSVNLENDLESTYKRPGKHTQPYLPEEASVPGNSYFHDEESRPTIENWEVDEFTHEEFVPDQDFSAPDDEAIISND